MSQIGLINEQGFIIGENFGFTPVKESELKNKEKEPEKEENNK